MQDIIVIYGPTAVGKSSIAVELAKMVNGEIISADSMQIYKNLNIGTAKIKKEEMLNIPHHLIDIVEPSEEYSVSNFCNDANNLIKQIISRKKTPIVVGGTGLYIKSLTYGYNFAQTAKDVQLRNNLENLKTEEIYSKVIEKDSKCSIDKNNRKRLIRYLEILNSGKTQNMNLNTENNFKLFAVLDDRQKIYNRINNRVDEMIKQGLLNEAEYLLKLNLSKDNQAIKAIGYKELFPYLQGTDSLDYCVNMLKQKTRNYAKRQITFLNQFDNVEIVNFVGVKETANSIFKRIEKTNG